MKKTNLPLAIALALALAGTACARKVVVDPETVQKLNSPGWNVKSEPRPQQ